MTIWYIETKEDNTASYTLFGDPEIGYATEPYRAHGYYEAETRSKAKAKFFKQYGLDFIEPVNMQRVVNCEECNNEGELYRLVGKSVHDPGDPQWTVCPMCQGKSIRYDVK